MKRTPTMRIRFTEDEVSLLNAVAPRPNPHPAAPPTARPLLMPGEPYDFTRDEAFEMRAALSEHRNHLMSVLVVIKRQTQPRITGVFNEIKRLDRIHRDLGDAFDKV